MKRLHLLFQVICQSHDQVLFEKRNVSTNTTPQNSDGDTKHRKTHKSKAFSVPEKLLTFDSNRYTPL